MGGYPSVVHCIAKRADRLSPFAGLHRCVRSDWTQQRGGGQFLDEANFLIQGHFHIRGHF